MWVFGPFCCVSTWTPSRVPACAYVCVSDPVYVFLGVGMPASLGVYALVFCVPRALFLYSRAHMRACIPVCV